MRLRHLAHLSLIAILTCAAHNDAHPAHLSTWVQIHQTLHTYPLAIDGKDSALFSQVFAPNAVANYTGPLANLTGLNAIVTGLQASVANLLSQHHLGTTVINVHEDKKSVKRDAGFDGEVLDERDGLYAVGQDGATTANSSVYFTANLFGTGKKYPANAHVYLYGRYEDDLVKLKQGWRILKRQLIFMGPFLGDQSLLGG